MAIFDAVIMRHPILVIISIGALIRTGTVGLSSTTNPKPRGKHTNAGSANFVCGWCYGDANHLGGKPSRTVTNTVDFTQD